MKRYIAICAALLTMGAPGLGQTTLQVDLWLAPLRNAWRETLQNVKFDSRSLLPSSVGILRGAAETASAPYRYVAGHSLLIRRLEIVNHPDFQPPDSPRGAPGPWTFPALMTRSFAVLGQPDERAVEGYLRQWADHSEALGPRWSAEDADRSPATIPLRLLAVINRLDQGRLECPGGQVCGAEFRFVYAGVTYPRSKPAGMDRSLENARDPYFTMSVEFVLPPLSKDEFRGFARSWMSLSVPMPGADPVKRLENVLQALFSRWAGSKERDIRIRVNSGVTRNWNMRQYYLDKNRGLALMPLDQQPSGIDVKRCIKKDSELGQFAASNADAILRAAYSFGSVCGKGLATCNAQVTPGDNKVMTLAPGVAGTEILDKIRFSLSLNSCRGCHGMETRGTPKLDSDYLQSTQFDQLKYRENGEEAGISHFLGGALDEPSFLPWTVNPPAAACEGSPSVAPHNYNDLLRRYLFNLAVMVVDENLWDETFRRTGLIAFQIH